MAAVLLAQGGRFLLPGEWHRPSGRSPSGAEGLGTWRAGHHRPRGGRRAAVNARRRRSPRPATPSRASDRDRRPRGPELWAAEPSGSVRARPATPTTAATARRLSPAWEDGLRLQWVRRSSATAAKLASAITATDHTQTNDRRTETRGPSKCCPGGDEGPSFGRRRAMWVPTRAGDQGSEEREARP